MPSFKHCLQILHPKQIFILNTVSMTLTQSQSLKLLGYSVQNKERGDNSEGDNGGDNRNFRPPNQRLKANSSMVCL